MHVSPALLEHDSQRSMQPCALRVSLVRSVLRALARRYHVSLGRILTPRILGVRVNARRVWPGASVRWARPKRRCVQQARMHRKIGWAAAICAALARIRMRRLRPRVESVVLAVFALQAHRWSCLPIASLERMATSRTLMVSPSASRVPMVISVQAGRRQCATAARVAMQSRRPWSSAPCVAPGHTNPRRAQLRASCAQPVPTVPRARVPHYSAMREAIAARRARRARATAQRALRARHASQAQQTTRHASLARLPRARVDPCV